MNIADSPSLLDRVLPVFDVHNYHTIAIHASPARVHAAIWETTAAEMPLFRLLMTIRALPARIAARRGTLPGVHRPLLRAFLTWNYALLAEEPPHEIVIGGISQPWKIDGGTRRCIVDADDFTTFAQPGFVRIAMNFRLAARDDRTYLSTETRVRATDDESRTQFGRYWAVIRIGSDIIRWDWLRVIKRRAERYD